MGHLNDPAPGADSVPRRVLVTGATGLLGGNTVRRLLDLGSQVTAVVRDEARARALLPAGEGLTLRRCDLRDTEGLAALLPGHDAVIHTAAYFREYYAPGGGDRELLLRTNVDATRALILAAAACGVETVVHLSSIGTLGSGTRDRPADEDTPPGRHTRRNGYYDSKVRSEEMIAALPADLPVRVPIILPGWMWGPGDAGPTSAGRLFLSVANGSLRAVPKAGNHVVDARDVAAACVRAAVDGRHRRRYVVAGRWVPLPEVCRLAAQAAGSPAPRAVPARSAMAVAALLETTARVRGRTPPATRAGVRALLEGNRRRVSSERAIAELGVVFRPLSETMRSQADWHRRHPALGTAVATSGAS
ncbi:NAD-dependent epimerase/dehydratase family protein [Streptomyces triticirhizae]|uniref:NAD-dependent epimerase/dehydratase family protein n=1 Tax=Streptomyces triticirhizae TaxID=2483353 RepID=A0A3M2LUG6_9ACTN|nr:NAD-dependent epimerase/dehydratase family protein [Streptomyces triticirhizae]RMI41129.1 NAD-dependent epimerase/dehydratase family protein [Streptomyces triticirhizae]